MSPVVARCWIDRLGYAYCATCRDEGYGRGEMQESCARSNLEPGDTCDGCGTDDFNVPAVYGGEIEHTVARIF